MTVREIAEETGQSKSTVHESVSGISRTNSRVRLLLSKGTKPETAALRIRETFGEGFALTLAVECAASSSEAVTHALRPPRRSPLT